MYHYCVELTPKLSDCGISGPQEVEVTRSQMDPRPEWGVEVEGTDPTLGP